MPIHQRLKGAECLWNRICFLKGFALGEWKFMRETVRRKFMRETGLVLLEGCFVEVPVPSDA